MNGINFQCAKVSEEGWQRAGKGWRQGFQCPCHGFRYLAHVNVKCEHMICQSSMNQVVQCFKWSSGKCIKFTKHSQGVLSRELPKPFGRDLEPSNAAPSEFCLQVVHAEVHKQL